MVNQTCATTPPARNRRNNDKWTATWQTERTQLLRLRKLKKKQRPKIMKLKKNKNDEKRGNMMTEEQLRENKKNRSQDKIKKKRKNK